MQFILVTNALHFQISKQYHLQETATNDYIH